MADCIYFPYIGGRGPWKIQGRGVKNAKNPGVEVMKTPWKSKGRG